MVHMGDELKTFIGDKDAEHNAEDVKKTRAMTIAPPFYVGDYTHGNTLLMYTKFTKFTGEILQKTQESDETINAMASTSNEITKFFRSEGGGCK
jgi:glutamine synthetase type III